MSFYAKININDKQVDIYTHASDSPDYTNHYELQTNDTITITTRAYNGCGYGRYLFQ